MLLTYLNEEAFFKELEDDSLLSVYLLEGCCGKLKLVTCWI